MFDQPSEDHERTKREALDEKAREAYACGELTYKHGEALADAVERACDKHKELFWEWAVSKLRPEKLSKLDWQTGRALGAIEGAAEDIFADEWEECEPDPDEKRDAFLEDQAAAKRKGEL